MERLDEELELDDRVLLASLSARLLGTPAAPVLLDRFVLVRRIGRGGMGTVYEARDPDRGERLALKTLPGCRVEGLQRLKREFRVASDLHHPNLVRLYELGVHEGAAYFTMELVDGSDFVRAVRADDPPGILQRAARERLRILLVQLASALSTLHRSGRLHGDVKPSNVLVTPEGRVVLLDFGLSSDTLELEERSAAPRGGTPGYAAPELARGSPATAASDWYSFGVLLIAALYGSRVSAAPSSSGADARCDLERLARELCNVDPALRPDGETILYRLGQATEREEPTVDDELVGRELELGQLDTLFRGRGTSPLVVVVSGVSGIGKSAVVRAFVRRIRAEANVCVLEGRCHERESLRFKALDGVVDSLTRLLQRSSAGDPVHRVPTHIRALAQLFPKLLEVPAIADAPHSPVSVEPKELRRRAGLAFKELLDRIASTRRLVLWIDDLQWGDTDSIAILGDLLSPPEPANVLLIVTHRSEDASSTPCLRALHGAAEDGLFALEHVHVSALPQQDALLLAARALTASGCEAHASAITAEADGHPLYITELARRARVRGGQVEEGLSLDAMIRERVESLEPEAVRLLRTLSAAGGPLDVSLACEIAQSPRYSALSELRRFGLVRTTTAERGHTLDTFHDRVREAVLAGLRPADRRELHMRLGLALEGRQGAEPGLVAWHFQQAGDRARGIPWTIRAAEAAAANLAWSTTMQLYRTALDLGPDRADRPRLLTALGEAARYAGRPQEAAEAYLEAASYTAGREAARLEHLAARELMRCGRYGEARKLLRELLANVGIRLPRTRLGMTLGIVLHAARLRPNKILNLSVRPQPPTEDALFQIELCSHIFDPDTFIVAYCAQKAALLAIRAGEPTRLAGAFTSVAVALAFKGPDPRIEMLLGRAEEIGTALADPHVQAITRVARCGTAVCGGQWHKALSLGEETEVVLRDSSGDVVYELFAVQAFIIYALDMLGRPKAYAERVGALRRELDLNGTLYWSLLAQAYQYQSLLYGDSPLAAKAALDAAISRWQHPGFELLQFTVSLGRVCVQLYEGDGAGAYATATAMWRAMRRGGGTWQALTRIQMLATLGRSAIAAYSSTRQRRLLKIAQRIAAKLEREALSLGPAYAALLRGLVGFRMADEGARSVLQDAADRFERLDMVLWASAVRLQLQRCGLADAGHSCDEATRMVALGVKNPVALANMYAPVDPPAKMQGHREAVPHGCGGAKADVNPASSSGSRGSGMLPAVLRYAVRRGRGDSTP